MAKLITFFAFMYLVSAVLAATAAGGGGIVSTPLTADIDADDTIIPVNNTQGFHSEDYVIIGEERIYYTARTTTAFGTVDDPAVRGYGGTTATSHLSDANASTYEAYILEQSLNYRLVAITDPAGVWGALSIPYNLFMAIGAFVTSPFKWLGADAQILTYVWACLSFGLLLVIGISLAGGRRVGA